MVAVGGIDGLARALLGGVFSGLAFYFFSRGKTPRDMAIATRAPKRVLGAAWWLGTALPFGVGIWATFLYLAVRLRRLVYLVWAALYLAALIGVLQVNARASGDPDGETIAAILMCGLWAAGILHSAFIRVAVRTQLDALAWRRENG